MHVSGEVGQGSHRRRGCPAAASSGADHRSTRRARELQAYNVGRAGDPAGAAELYAALVADCTRLLGPDHPDTLNTRENHARNIGEAGDPTRAADLYSALAADRTRRRARLLRRAGDADKQK